MKKKVNPADEIKNYSLKEGTYSITVKVLEGNDMLPKNKGFLGFGGTQLCTSQVEVEVHKKKKKSKILKEQSSPVYNQGWTFYLKDLKLDELQDMTIKFTVLDRSSSLFTYVIGQYEMDLTSVYFQLNHEYFHTWLTLTDPTDEIEGPTGYLFVNVSVLGPNDEPVVHDIEDAKKASSGKEKALVPGKVDQTGHQIEINIYRAENLPLLDSNLDGIDAYVVAKFGGVIGKSKVVLSRNPEWNECIRLQCMLPCQSKQITIALYDKDLGSEDDLVGQLKLSLSDIQYKKHVPKWGNLYGAPSTASGKAADLMNFYGQTQGSHYRGRLLYSCSSYNKKEPKTSTKALQFSFPNNPIPQTKMRSYLLWIDIIEGNEIPDKNSEVIVHASIGPYMLNTKPKSNIGGQVNWFESLEERKVIFPEDIDQVPDLIFYVTDQNREDRRMSFNRIKASKVLRTFSNEFDPSKDHETVLLELKEDRSLDLVKDDEFPGFLIAKVSLLNFRPFRGRQFLTEQQQLKNIQDLCEYQLRVQLYQGRGLPPADETGGCDPFVKVKCAGKVGTSKAKPKTLNPGWFESVNLDRISLPSMQSLMETKYPTKGMFLTVYDCDENSSQQSAIGAELNGIMTKIDQLDIKKQFNTIYSKIMNKPIESQQNDSLESPKTNGLSESKISLLGKSKLNQQTMETAGTPRETGDEANLSLNESGILIADPDKVQKDLLGRIWIPLEASHIRFGVKSLLTPNADAQHFDILYRRPKWYPIKYDATGEYTGQVLLSYTLIPQAYSDVIKSKPSLFPTFDYKTVSFFLIGVREIDEECLGRKLSKISASLDVSGDSEKATKTDEMKVANGGSNANQYVELRIQVPKNKSFDPVVDVFLWDCSRAEPYEFLGYGSLSFKDIPFLKYSKAADENADVQSEMSLVDCLREAIYLEKKMGQDQEEKEVFDVDQVIDKKNRQVFKRDEHDEDDLAHSAASHPSSTVGNINLQDQYIPRKVVVEEIEEEPEEDIMEENVSQKVQSIENKARPSQTLDFQIVDVQEKTFDKRDIIVSAAYDSNQNGGQEVAERLIQNLPSRGPLDLTKKNTQPSRIYDVNDKETMKMNEFFANQPLQQNEGQSFNQNPGSDRLGLLGKGENNQMHHLDNHQEHDLQTNGTHVSGQDHDMNEAPIVVPEKKTRKSQYFEISTFNPPESLTFSVKSHSKRSLHYADMPKEGRIVKDEVDVQQDKLVIAGNILNMFKKKGGPVILEYEDFDTDEDEDLDITPEWKKNREVFLSEFEDRFKPSKKLCCIPVMRGQQRGVKKNVFAIDKPEDPAKFAVMKCLFIDPLNPNSLQKVEELKRLLRERSYFIRTYITRGKNIGGEGSSLDSYLKIKLGDKIVNLKDKTLCEGTNNPDYYVQHDIECKLPGSALLEVQIWSDVFGADEMIGRTTVDMENRLFTGKWLQYERKPFENRNIFPEGETVSKGNLEMWVELIPKTVIRQTPPIPITKPPRFETEIRVIVWETKDCVFKDEAEKCNDVYVRVGLQNKSNEAQETDIHWRCRSNGFFNWRMKFKQTFPLNNDEYGGDKLFVQLLDKDLVASDDIIGSCIIDLNQHKMIDKCMKRQKSVPLQLRELNRKAKIADKIWYQVYNPLVRDKANKPIMQGQVCLSIEVMPKKLAEERKNGFGRDSPNSFPALDEPPGRMKFDLLHPLEFLKTLIGPDLYRKFCGTIIFVICFIVCLGVGWILVSQIIATSIAA